MMMMVVVVVMEWRGRIPKEDEEISGLRLR